MPLSTPNYTPEQKEAAQQLLEIMEAQESLHEFLKQGWTSIEGGVPFISGWHIQAIAEHLEACYRREIKNLLIHIPPRSSKTSLISVAFPAWVWLQDPTQKFMYASYAASLALEHSLKCRRLIESSFYQSRWGHLYQLASDQNAKSYFENTAGGYRISTSVGASATGRGGNILVCDDPNNAKDGESELKRDGTNSWWSQVWSTRLNDPKQDVKIVVQQRLHQQDVSGYVMSGDDSNEWVRLILPMEFEGSRRARTIILPSTKGKVWQDPRKEEGDLLCPDRFSMKEVKRYKADLGSYGYAGQYQQRPAPEEGGIIKKHWFRWWKQSAPPPCKHIIQSWDTALEANDKNAYSACTTWGVFEHNGAMNVILLSSWRGKVEYPDLRTRAQRLYKDYRDMGDEELKPDGRHVPDTVLIEAKVSGISLVQEMMRAGVNAFRFNPNKYGDKVQRVRLVTHLIEGGRVWMPAKPPEYTKLRSFAEIFIEDAAIFAADGTGTRDLVDTMTQTLIRLKDGGWITHPADEESEPYQPIEKKFYG